MPHRFSFRARRVQRLPSRAGLWLAGVLAGALALAGPAQALRVSSVSADGHLVDTSFTGASQVGVDLGLLSDAPVWLQFTLDAADVAAGGLPFNAVIDQLMSGARLGPLRLALDGGAVFATVGSVSALGGAAATAMPLDATATQVLLAVAAPGSTQLLLGDPLLQGGLADWHIGFGSLGDGDSFGLSLNTVPEPASAVLALVALFGLLAQRRKG